MLFRSKRGPQQPRSSCRRSWWGSWQKDGRFLRKASVLARTSKASRQVRWGVHSWTGRCCLHRQRPRAGATEARSLTLGLRSVYRMVGWPAAPWHGQGPGWLELMVEDLLPLPAGSPTLGLVPWVLFISPNGSKTDLKPGHFPTPPLLLSCLCRHHPGTCPSPSLYPTQQPERAFKKQGLPCQSSG